MSKQFVTEKYRDRRFKSLRDYIKFIRSRRISKIALGRQSETGEGVANKGKRDDERIQHIEQS